MLDITTYITCAVIGLVPAYVAHRKGRNFWLWWFFGAGMFILAMPAALLMKHTNGIGPRSPRYTPPAEPEAHINEDDRRPCPHCAESIKKEARFCRFCQLEVGLATERV